MERAPPAGDARGRRGWLSGGSSPSGRCGGCVLGGFVGFVPAWCRAPLRRLLRSGPAAARSREQLDGLAEVDGRRVDAAGHGGVQLAVGDVGAVAAVEDADGDAGLGVRRRARRSVAWCGGHAVWAGRTAPRALGKGDGEQLGFGLEAAAVGPLLQVRAVAAVLRGDLDAVVADADDAGQRQQLERLVEGHRVDFLVGQQRRPFRLLLRAVLHLAELHERPVAAGQGEDRQLLARGRRRGRVGRRRPSRAALRLSRR